MALRPPQIVFLIYFKHVPFGHLIFKPRIISIYLPIHGNEDVVSLKRVLLRITLGQNLPFIQDVFINFKFFEISELVSCRAQVVDHPIVNVVISTHLRQKFRSTWLTLNFNLLPHRLASIHSRREAILLSGFPNGLLSIFGHWLSATVCVKQSQRKHKVILQNRC